MEHTDPELRGIRARARRDPVEKMRERVRELEAENRRLRQERDTFARRCDRLDTLLEGGRYE